MKGGATPSAEEHEVVPNVRPDCKDPVWSLHFRQTTLATEISTWSPHLPHQAPPLDETGTVLLETASPPSGIRKADQRLSETG